MIKYSTDIAINELCVGVFANTVTIPDQFSMIKKMGKADVAMYIFYITEISELGVTISNPLNGDSKQTIPLDQITKIKVISTGSIVEIEKTESVTKEEICKYFMEVDDASLELYVITSDLDYKLHTFTGMQIIKGKVSIECRLGYIDIDNVYKKSCIRLGK